MVTEHGSNKPLVRNVMTLGTCAPIVGSEVMSFSSEEQLLKARPSLSTCRLPLSTDHSHRSACRVRGLHRLCVGCLNTKPLPLLCHHRHGALQ